MRRPDHLPERRLGRPDRAERAAGLVRRLRHLVPVNPDARRWWSALVFAVCGALLMVSAALADRHFHRGVMTGEESPYVFHPTGRRLATNLDLDVLGGEQLDLVASTLQSSGFRFVRMTFRWSDIEPASGQFDWQRTDAIVETFSERDVRILAVLRGTPEWARLPAPGPAEDAPPADPAGFGAFAAAFAERYGKEISFVQIWDRPNLSARWGGAGATPGEYVELLATAHAAIKAVMPDVAVVLAEFEPRPEPGAPDDLSFLRGIYAAGASQYFDIVAATVDGGGRSPFDRDVAADRTNLSRLILFRDIMEDAGDGQTPVWGTRYGWPTGSPPSGVTPERQAEFAVAGIERTRQEWPWLGLLFAWAFVTPPGDPAAAYAVLTPEGASTALFTALSSFASAPSSTAAGIGYIPTDARSLNYVGRWQGQDLPPRSYQTTTEVGASVRIVFDGTGVIAYLRRGPSAGAIDASVDGRSLPAWSGSSLASFQARDVPLTLISGLDDGRHELVLTLAEAGDLTLGGFIVTRDLPFLWPVGLLAVGGVLCLGLSVWQTTRLVAIRSGLLRQDRGPDVWVNVPEFAHVPTVRRV